MIRMIRMMGFMRELNILKMADRAVRWARLELLLRKAMPYYDSDYDGDWSMDKLIDRIVEICDGKK